MYIIWMLANNVIYADILSIISQYIAHVVDNTNISLNVWENMLLGKDDYEYNAYSPYSGFFPIADCNNTFYGINCTQKCNKRCMNYNCHHENGECIEDKKVCYLVLSIYSYMIL